MVSGSVKKSIIGFINVFTTPSTIATRSTVEIASTFTPGKIYAATTIAIALINK